jgi:hypothetical protein
MRRGANHLVQSVNSSIRIHDKVGNVLAGGPDSPITLSSLQWHLDACGSERDNQGDGFVFYDTSPTAAGSSVTCLLGVPGNSFSVQCIGVSNTDATPSRRLLALRRAG